MKKLMISLAAAAAIGAAVPAAAQTWGYNSGYDRYDGGYGRYDGAYVRNYSAQVNYREARLSEVLHRALRVGRISHSEYVSLTSELRSIKLLEERYRYRGFRPGEAAAINARLDRLEARTQYVMNDSRYGRAYGYNQPWGRGW